MFANLKNKLIEEVKASPSKFQQFATAAQAAVSSSTSAATTPSSSSETNDSGTSENFFSITEEDTPQNSPYRLHKQPRLSRSSTKSVNGMGPSTGSRTRKLSNSSMASDVSFRLPSYDAPPIYHLPPDVDENSSEFDDSASTARLDIITKEQLYDAYKKALDRYHKYRLRYNDLATKYKELERDTEKARAVLVETQEKALRRIAELREQCALEQQAKAHLEESLRMEMDDMRCQIQAYETKLRLLGEDPENIKAALERGKKNADNKLIDLEETMETTPAGSQSIQEHHAQVKKLEKLLAEQTAQLNQLMQDNKEANGTIAALRKQEEENVLLLAQTKQAIHTELEDKETEVRQLQNKVKQLEVELDLAIGRETQSGEIKEQLKKLQNAKQEVEAKLIATEHVLSTVRSEKDQQLAAQQKAIESEYQQLHEQLKRQADVLVEANDMKEQLKLLQNDKQEAEKKVIVLEQLLNNLKLEQADSDQQHASQLKPIELELEQKDKQLQEVLEQLKQQNAARETQNNHIKQLETDKELMADQLIAAEQQLRQLKLENTEQEQQMAAQLEQRESQVTQLQENLVQLEAELVASIQNDDIKKHLEQLLNDSEQMVTKLQVQHSEKEQQLLHELEKTKNQSLEDTRLQKEQLKRMVQLHDKAKASLSEVQVQLALAKAQLKEQEQSVVESEKIMEEERETVAAVLIERTAFAEQLQQMQRELQIFSNQQRSDTSSRQGGTETVASLRSQVKALSGQLADAQSAKVAKEKELKASSNKLHKLKKQHEQLQARHSEQASQLKQLKVESCKLEELRNEKLELQQRVNVILEEITTMQAHLQEVQTAHTKLELEKIQLESHIESLQQEKQQEHSTHDQLSNTTLQEIKQENTKLAERNCLLEEQNNHLQKQEDELTKLQNKMQEVLDEHSKLQNAQEIMEHDHRSLQDKSDAFEKENQELNDKLKLVLRENRKLEAKFNCTKRNLIKTENELRDQLKEHKKTAIAMQLLEKKLLLQAKQSSDLEAGLELMQKEMQAQLETSSNMVQRFKRETKESAEMLDLKVRMENRMKICATQEAQFKEIDRQLRDQRQVCSQLRDENVKLMGLLSSSRNGSGEALRQRLEQKLSEQTRHSNELEKKLQQLQEELEIHNQCAPKLQEVEKQLADQTQRSADLKLRYEDAEERYTKQRQTYSELQERYLELEQKVVQHEENSAQLLELTKQLTEQTQRSDKLDAIVQEMKNEMELQFQNSTQLREQSLAEFQELGREHEMLKTMYASLQEDHSDLDKELSSQKEWSFHLETSKQSMREELAEKTQAVQSTKDKLQAATAAHTTQLETLEARWSAANADVNRLQEANDALMQEIETLKNSIQQQSNYEQLLLENEYLNNHTKQLEMELAALGEGGDVKEKLKSLQCELYVLQEQAEQHATQLAEKETQSDAIKAEAAQLKSAMEEQALELTRQSEHASFVSGQSDTVQKELLHVQQQLQERQTELAKTLERCLGLEEQLNNQPSQAEQSTTALPNDAEHLRTLNEQLQRELEDLKHKSSGEQSNLQQEIDELQTNNKEMTDRITELETLRAGIQAQQLLASLAPKSSQQAAAEVDEKTLLEAKLKEIMNEVQDVTNRNLFLEQKCENFLILEQSNERLKLQNAQISRQLDETLVSIQHNDGVPANTEFEYLRNIMFQYLTGNTNNETLVKVISAVLKFSPQQAQVAIEKEHQRRSLLNKLL